MEQWLPSPPTLKCDVTAPDFTAYMPQFLQAKQQR